VLVDCGTGQLVELKSADQRVEMVLAGGAGYGPPSDRDPAAVSRDLALG
jgi:5-oxoprolinase (ATP-hydrolysing)